MRQCQWLVSPALALVLTLATFQQAGAESLVRKSAGVMAFGPDGVLFVADAKTATIFAIETGDVTKTDARPNVSNVDQLIAKALGTKADEIAIVDMAVNPASNAVYFSVSRGLGADATPVLVRVSPQGDITEVDSDSVKFTKAELPNPPEDALVGQGRRRKNNRTESITDIEYQNGKLHVAGLSNEEFASTFRSIPYPFSKVTKGAAVEIYHASHNAVETGAPIRTFTTYTIAEQPHLLAGYTCTPLVKIPLDELNDGQKVRGVTVAELGNRNRPLDMFVYNKGGEDFILMANSNRGLMKISTKDIDRETGLTERVADRAGQEYETVVESGVEQLDRLGDKHAAMLIKTDKGFDLVTRELP
ncbi:MAG: hypothetical protein KDB14_15905 [Planctomycetales bacterium]|nr:hypothetical protein [Planctomycetales bacterium]